MRGLVMTPGKVMGAIEDIYEDEDLESTVSLEEFREAVEEKVAQMGGLADEETAAMLVAHEFDDEEISGVADIEPGMEEVTFVAKVTGIGDLRTFERDGEDEEGRVINVELADETGAVRGTFWDERAQRIADGEVEVGDVLKIKGRPKEGLTGVEVNVDRAEVDEETEVDVQVSDTYQVEDLSLGLSDVNLRAKLLDTDTVRTFERDDGSEGKVSNLVVGDETGRMRITLWDEIADVAEELDPGISVEIVDGYVRERDGDLEVHLNQHSAVEPIDEEIEFVPNADDIADLELGDNAEIAGVVRSADPKRTFDRDDGSEGQVRNIRVQDGTGDIRVALWDEKADIEVGPGDEVHVADVEIQDGWQDDIEASANWRSTVTVLDDSELGRGGSDPASGGSNASTSTSDDQRAGTGLDAFAGDDGSSTSSSTSSDASGGDTGEADADGSGADADLPRGEGATVEFTGTVVQAGEPVILDDGEETLSVETEADVSLGQEVTVRGTMSDGRLDADELL